MNENMRMERAYPIALKLGYLSGLLALHSEMHHARFGWAFGPPVLPSLTGTVSSHLSGRRLKTGRAITLDSWASARQAREPFVLRVPCASIRWFPTLPTLVACVYPKYFSPDPVTAFERLGYRSFAVAYIEALVSFVTSIRIQVIR